MNYQLGFAQRWRELHDPHVRALAWLLEAPDLLDAQAQWQGLIATLGPDCAASAANWLRQLQHEPAPLHAALALQPLTRLGRYAEKLLAFYFASEHTLFAHGLQVQAHKNQTIGEFDFLLWQPQGLVHWEFATKFYFLQERPDVVAGDRFIGPNLADTLGKKMHKILHRQLALGTHAAAQIHLPQRLATAQALIKGWLFYHASGAAELQSAGVAIDHCRGFWCVFDELDLVPSTQRYAVLARLEWLAPARLPIARGLDREQLQKSLNQHFASDSMPVLVALLEPDEDVWIETARGFIVPNDWQQRAADTVIS